MFYTTDQMRAIFSRENHVRSLLRFESALATAQARAGVIPEDAARAIADACETMPFDTDALFAEVTRTGTLAIPLVKELSSHAGAEPGAYVHWGATSQDAIDTGFMLQISAGLNVIEDRIDRISKRCAELADQHRETPMIGRTLTQQALPVTFGLKAARWLALFTRQSERLQPLRATTLAIQLGGAVGTLASLGASGPLVQQYLAEELELGNPDLPWHTERDRAVETGTALGAIAGAARKVTGDLLILVQSEIGEISERTETGKGGSSTMPHKRNPVDLVGAEASARLATSTAGNFFDLMEQTNERSAGTWQSEWELVPKLFQHTDYALERLSSALDGLEVQQDRMKENLNLTNGLIMAESLAMMLAGRIGRTEAYRLVDAASQRVLETGEPMAEICQNDDEIRNVLSTDEIDNALDPLAYLGSTDTFIDNVLARHESTKYQHHE